MDSIHRVKGPGNLESGNRQHRTELVQIINTHHFLVKLAHAVNWDRIDELFGETFASILVTAGNQHPPDGFPSALEVYAHP